MILVEYAEAEKRLQGSQDKTLKRVGRWRQAFLVAVTSLRFDIYATVSHLRETLFHTRYLEAITAISAIDTVAE